MERVRCLRVWLLRKFQADLAVVVEVHPQFTICAAHSRASSLVNRETSHRPSQPRAPGASNLSSVLCLLARDRPGMTLDGDAIAMNRLLFLMAVADSTAHCYKHLQTMALCCQGAENRHLLRCHDVCELGIPLLKLFHGDLAVSIPL